MTLLDRFFEYAAEFEKTFGDDDWSRLERFFHPDATYEVRNAPFACRLEGRDAIFRGIRKSLDGFDRRCTTRELDVTEPPAEEGDRVTVCWKGTYRIENAPPLEIRGRSEARYVNGRIAELSDTYDSSIIAGVDTWLRTHGRGLDLSYV